MTDVPVRRFEMGVSTAMVDEALARAGYKLRTLMGRSMEILPLIPRRGRGKRVTIKQLLKIVDEQRLKDGLEPIVRAK